MSYENKQPSEHVEDDELSLVAMLNVFLAHKKLIAAVVAAFIALAGLYVVLVAPTYSSRILIAVEDAADTSTARNLLGDVSAMFDVKSSADGEIQILGSRLVASRTVDALMLNVRAEPRYFPLIGRWIASRADSLSDPGLFGMGGFDWGTESIRLASFDVPRELQREQFKLVALTNGRYELSGKGLTEPVAGAIGKTERFSTPSGDILLNVSSMAGHPGAAFTLRSRSRQITTDDLIKSLQIAEQGKRSGVIAASLEGKDPALLSRTLNDLGRQYVEQNADRKAAQAEHSIRFLEAQLPVMKQQLEEAETRLSQYQNAHTIVDLSEAGKVVLQKSADADTQLVALKQKREDLATRFGPAHPALQAIDEQIGLVSQQIDRLTGQIRQMPLTEQDLLKLQRDVRVSTDLYIAMRSNVEQLRLVKAGKIGNVRLIDYAEAPEVPVKPRKLITLLASAMLGLLVGAVAAVLKDRLFTGVLDSVSLETHTGLTVFATVPHSKRQEGMSRRSQKDGHRSLLFKGDINDAAIESLRSLRTALTFALLKASNNVVLVSGPAPGLGKSFVSANLAAVLAASGKRVLLIDGDMRKGYLHEYFGLPRRDGLAEAIASARPFETAAHHAVLPNLDFLTSGDTPPNPSELLLRKSWAELLAQASRAYDLVLVDAPPVLAVSDVEAISGTAGSVFLVARYGVTRLGEVSESIKRLQKAGSEVTGLLFNSVKARGGLHDGRGQTYQYTDYGYYRDHA